MKKIILILIATALLSACGQEVTLESGMTPEEIAAIDLENITQDIRTISLEEFKTLSSNQDYIVIDIRTPQETKFGIIGEMDLEIDYYKNFVENIKTLDKNAKYILYCNSGNRTGDALKIMKDMGFTTVYDLKGGITNWKKQGEPVFQN